MHLECNHCELPPSLRLTVVKPLGQWTAKRLMEHEASRNSGQCMRTTPELTRGGSLVIQGPWSKGLAMIEVHHLFCKHFSLYDTDTSLYRVCTQYQVLCKYCTTVYHIIQCDLNWLVQFK